MHNRPGELVRTVSLTTILLPVLLPTELDGGFLRFLGSFRQAHNLKVVGSNFVPTNNDQLRAISQVIVYRHILRWS